MFYYMYKLLINVYNWIIIDLYDYKYCYYGLLCYNCL